MPLITKVMLDMVHLEVYSAHVCLLCQLLGRCLNLPVYEINLIYVKGSVAKIYWKI